MDPGETGLAPKPLAHELGGARVEEVVRVEEDDDLARRSSQPRVEGGCLAAVVLQDGHDPLAERLDHVA